MVHEDEILGKAYDARLMRRILVYLRPYRKLVALAFVLIFANTLAVLAGPFLTGLAIDQAIAPQDRSVSPPVNLPPRPENLPPILAAFLGALVLAFIFRYAQNYIMQMIGQNVMYDLRKQIFSHLQYQSLGYYDRNPVGRLISRLTNDVDALNEFIGSGLVTVAGDVVILLGVVVVMFLVNWQLALVSLAVLPLILLASFFFQKLMRTTYRQQRVRIARVNAFLQENISGMLVVQLFNREKKKFDEFDKLNKDYLDANIEALRVFCYFFPVVSFLSVIATAGLLGVGSGGVLSGAVQVGVLVMMFQYTEQAFQPIRDLAEKYNIMQGAMASAERVFMLLDEEATIVDSPKPRELRRVVGDIEFRNVEFAYNPDEPVLKGISFHIPAGTSVALVGATGAGKTSIISLLSRFYDVQGGQILLDGVDVRDVKQQDLRRHIGVVLQDPVLFSGSIARNIRLLDEDISDEEVRRAAAFVNAATFIERLPEQYDYEVKERGANLSVGQRQLLTFARAIAFNPSVLLVMDEATSSVDTETEALIQDALYKLMRGRTSIIIAHRLSTIRHVDRIIVLHKGRVVEDGTHEDLMARNGYYYRLYQLQYQEQEGTPAEGVEVAGEGSAVA
ncbi:MAG: ABC transporter ATP-binding protein/permease [Chloroflexota bacterium]|nr:ABC transporter ATP-binding protein/permease [Chloroflexota bacterium]